MHIGPSDHVPWLDDRKWAYIRLEGRNFGDVPLNIELKLEVWDSPNSAGVIIDAVRCCKLALDRGIGGPLAGPSAYFMKSPAVQYHDDEAREMVEAFIRGDVKHARSADACDDHGMTDTGPTDHELRLLGDVAGKRVLDLGCGDGTAAVTFAQQGAVVIAVDALRRAPRARARTRASEAEVKVEWRAGDLADLAFLRADSIDAAFSADAVAEVDDLGAPVPPGAAGAQAQRAVRVLVRAPDGAVHRRQRRGRALVLRSRARSTSTTRRRLGAASTPATSASVFTELGRAGFRVDTILEPRPDTPGEPGVPDDHRRGAPARKAPESLGTRLQARCPARRAHASSRA